jgi:hypothetical protein
MLGLCVSFSLSIRGEFIRRCLRTSDDVKRWKDSLSLLKNADSEFEQVLSEKARHIEENGSDTARTLIELTQQIAELTADQKELDEATEAGQSALDAVQGIQAALGSAANWGTWDMFGGGVLTAMAKQSKLDDAKDLARIAERKLIQFQEEPADADERLQVSLQIDGFSKFADFFFDVYDTHAIGMRQPNG